MAAKTRKKVTARKRVNKNDEILALLKGLDRKFTKKFDSLDKKFTGKFNGLDWKFNDLEKKYNGLDGRLIRFETETMRRFDELELKIIGFKDDLLSAMDFVRKEYDETRQERIATGAVQDRQQEEIAALKISDGKQNQALKALETRVTDLEMNKAA